jgi:glycosyltransferase involved in cell wall biosynthesis
VKKIVISAVNLNQGGPLSILKDCLKAFQKIQKIHDLDITVFVHKIALVNEYVNDFEIIEYPLIKASWLKRIHFEYYQCKKISLRLSPYLWIALHDITPNVACKQIVYCHNASPFYKFKLSDAFTDTTFFLFCLFYRFLYGINIKKNKFIIVQQQWLREEFERNYKVNTIVSYPFFDRNIKQNLFERNEGNKFQFFFPAFPRVAKNFETLLQATKLLSAKRKDFELILTIDGTENKYSKKLFDDYCNVEQINFMGAKTREDVFEIYKRVDCLIFPSKLETWGLPISEFKNFNKPMLLSNLKYAHETLGKYQIAKFFDPDNAEELSAYMSLLIDNNLIFDNNEQVLPKDPFFNNWDELINFVSTEL